MKSYPFAILFSLTAVVVGLVLQISLGSISKNWFSFPYNVVGGAIFVLLTTLSYFLFRKTNFILRCSSAPFAIVTVVTLGILTIGLGSINVKPHQLSGFLGKMGLDDLTKTWYFGLVFVLALTNLWFSILKRSMVYQRKNIAFSRYLCSVTFQLSKVACAPSLSSMNPMGFSLGREVPVVSMTKSLLGYISIEKFLSSMAIGRLTTLSSAVLACH